MSTFQIRSEGLGYILLEAEDAASALRAFSFPPITPLHPQPSLTPDRATAVDANGVTWEAVAWPPASA